MNNILDDIMKDKEEQNNFKATYSAMDECQIVLLRTNNDMAEAVMKTSGYNNENKMMRLSKILKYTAKKLEKNRTSVNIIYLTEFLEILNKIKQIDYDSKWKLCDYIYIDTAQDEALRIIATLINMDDDEEQYIEFWLAPRVI